MWLSPMGLFSIVIIVVFKQGGDRVVVLRGWGGGKEGERGRGRERKGLGGGVAGGAGHCASVGPLP